MPLTARPMASEAGRQGMPVVAQLVGSEAGPHGTTLASSAKVCLRLAPPMACPDIAFRAFNQTGFAAHVSKSVEFGHSDLVLP